MRFKAPTRPASASGGSPSVGGVLARRELLWLAGGVGLAAVAACGNRSDVPVSTRDSESPLSPKNSEEPGEEGLPTALPSFRHRSCAGRRGEPGRPSPGESGTRSHG